MGHGELRKQPTPSASLASAALLLIPLIKTSEPENIKWYVQCHSDHTLESSSLGAVPGTLNITSENTNHHTEKMAIKPITVEPIAVPEGSSITFGAVVSNVDIENLTGRS